jgi:hypothetical protein
MKLLQLNFTEIPLLTDKPNIIVESQEYGQLSDFRFNVVVPDAVADELTANTPIRIIEDKGRTIGFWQRLGGKGVYEPKLAPLQAFSKNVLPIIVKCTPAQLSFTGKTWNDIILSMPNKEENTQIFNLSISDSNTTVAESNPIAERDTTNKSSRKTKTGSKKTTRKKKSTV